jgi:hypothetical protein
MEMSLVFTLYDSIFCRMTKQYTKGNARCLPHQARAKHDSLLGNPVTLQSLTRPTNERALTYFCVTEQEKREKEKKYDISADRKSKAKVSTRSWLPRLWTNPLSRFFLVLSYIVNTYLVRNEEKREKKKGRGGG